MFACNAQFSMHWGRQCAAPNALPDAWPGSAPKGASPGLGGGAESFFSVVLCWQNVKMCECLLATPSFQCIGGGSVPPPISCRTLGRAARRKARRLALARPECNFLSCFGRIVYGKTRCRGKTGVAMQCTASRLETLRTAPLKTP